MMQYSAVEGGLPCSRGQGQGVGGKGQGSVSFRLISNTGGTYNTARAVQCSYGTVLVQYSVRTVHVSTA